MFGERSPEFQAHRAHKLKVSTHAETAQSVLLVKSLIAGLEKKRVIHIHSYRADEILMFTRVAQDFGLEVATFQHVLEAYKVAPEALWELGAEVFTIGNEPNGFNINHEVGSTAPEKLTRKVREMRADIGIALDGDADRVLVVGRGERAEQARRQLQAIVRTVPSITAARVYSPTAANREAFAREWSSKLGIPVTPVDSAEAAAKGRDIVLCSTSSLDPVFFKKWVEPGMHLSTIKGHEIEPAAMIEPRILLT